MLKGVPVGQLWKNLSIKMNIDDNKTDNDHMVYCFNPLNETGTYKAIPI